MEWSVLFMGPVGAGKTQAIRTISDIEVVNTDMAATDDTRKIKPMTTVSMDVGVLHLEGGDKIRLYGAPGQERFDFMWNILLAQVRGLILLIDESRGAPLTDLEGYLQAMEERLGKRKLPLVIGITHLDLQPGATLDKYDALLKRRSTTISAFMPPVFAMDARNKSHVKASLVAIAAMQEMAERFRT